MAALTTVTAARAGVSGLGSAAGVSGDTFANTGGEVAIVSNSTGGLITVTFVTSGTEDGLSITDRTVTMASGTRYAIGPFPRYLYGSTVSITYSQAAGTTVAILKVVPATT